MCIWYMLMAQVLQKNWAQLKIKTAITTFVVNAKPLKAYGHCFSKANHEEIKATNAWGVKFQTVDSQCHLQLQFQVFFSFQNLHGMSTAPKTWLLSSHTEVTQTRLMVVPLDLSLTWFQWLLYNFWQFGSVKRHWRYYYICSLHLTKYIGIL